VVEEHQRASAAGAKAGEARGKTITLCAAAWRAKVYDEVKRRMKDEGVRAIAKAVAWKTAVNVTLENGLVHTCPAVGEKAVIAFIAEIRSGRYKPPERR
jgi:hypothetical protein